MPTTETTVSTVNMSFCLVLMRPSTASSRNSTQHDHPDPVVQMARMVIGNRRARSGSHRAATTPAVFTLPDTSRFV